MQRSKQAHKPYIPLPHSHLDIYLGDHLSIHIRRLHLARYAQLRLIWTEENVNEQEEKRRKKEKGMKQCK